MMAGTDMTVRFWGVRGSVPVSAPDKFAFGGNTPCVEVRCGDRTVVFDAGTGCIRLGEKLAANTPGRVDLFFTHCHYDHIQGLPFFAPLLNGNWTIGFWSGHLEGRMTTKQMIDGYMQHPYFPVGPECFSAGASYNDLKAGEPIDLGDGIALTSTWLNHPDNALGYRIDFDGKSVCYVTDTEHVPGEPDRNVLALIDKADIVIYDGMYADETFSRYQGFGHSTWQEGLRLCAAAGVKEYVVFHHNPTKTDAQLAEIESDLKKLEPSAMFAREGLVLKP